MAYDPRKDAEETFTKDTGLPGSALPPGPGYVLDPNGKIVVGDSTYYPSTTNGKLDLFSKTVAVENAPAPAAPVAQDSPFGIIDQQAGTLKTRFLEQAKRLRDQNLPPEQHNKILAGMQADYDGEKYKLADINTQLKGVQSAIDSGIVDPEIGRQTQWKIAAPHMAAAMAPREAAVRAPMEPGTLNTQQKWMEGFVNAAEKQPGWFQPRAFDSLLEKYQAYRAESGYDQMPPGQQQQIDLRWDYLMKGDSKNKTWDPTDPRVSALRTYGSRLLGVAAQKVTGKRITPFAQGVNTPAESKTLDKATAAALLQEAGGDKNKARQLAKDRGYSF